MTDVQEVPLKKITPSPFNRKNLGNLAELTESIKTHGVLQPPTVRPIGENGHTTYELVMGERRWRAADAAGLKTMTVFVRSLSDKEVLEVQLIENVQRADLDPVEEAEGYQRLHRDHGYSIDDLAAKLGKSKSYVYCRLRLTSLIPEARAALSEEKITPVTALYIARIPESLQIQALKEITNIEMNDGDPLGAGTVRKILQKRFMLRLADAPFDRADGSLVTRAGTCMACPKRTGAQPELFADVKAKDTCTDPTCFKAKCDAHWVKQQSDAKARGEAVIDDKTAKKELFPFDRLRVDAGFVDLDDQFDWRDPAPAKTWRDVIGKKLGAEAITLARDPAGKVHELVKESEAKKLAPKEKKAAERAPEPAPVGPSPAERMKSDAERAAQGVALGLVVAKLEKRELDAKLWRIVVRDLIDVQGVIDDEVLRRRGVLKDDTDFDAARVAFDKSLDKMSVGELRGLFIELTVFGNMNQVSLETTPLNEMCAALKIDRKALAAKELARLKAEAKTKAKAS